MVKTKRYKTSSIQSARVKRQRKKTRKLRRKVGHKNGGSKPWRLRNLFKKHESEGFDSLPLMEDPDLDDVSLITDEQFRKLEQRLHNEGKYSNINDVKKAFKKGVYKTDPDKYSEEQKKETLRQAGFYDNEAIQ